MKKKKKRLNDSSVWRQGTFLKYSTSRFCLCFSKHYAMKELQVRGAWIPPASHVSPGIHRILVAWGLGKMHQWCGPLAMWMWTHRGSRDKPLVSMSYLKVTLLKLSYKWDPLQWKEAVVSSQMEQVRKTLHFSHFSFVSVL